MKKKSLIIDASAILAVLLNEEVALDVLEKTNGYTLFSSECLPFEICNSLSKHLKRNLISCEHAQKIYEIFEKLPIELLESDFQNTLSYCAEEKHYAYDMFYLASAIKNNLPLLTLDNKLSEIANKRGVVCM